MFEGSPSIWQIAVAVALIAFGCIAGFIADRILANRLARIPLILRWAPNRILFGALRGAVFVWSTLLGMRAAMLVIPLEPRFDAIAKDLMLAIVLLLATVVLARITVGFVTYYAHRADGVAASTSIFANIARIVVFALGILIVLQSLGISITPALAALGVGGLAVALALQDTLSNIFAGLHIIASNQVQSGDYVRLSQNEAGFVTDINWRNTTIRSLDNNMVIVPNARLASSVVTNYGQPEPEMAVLVEVGVSYDCDLDHVERVTIDVARDVNQDIAGGVPAFDPFIRYHTFGPYRIDYTVILRAQQFADQYLLKHEFVKRLHRRFQAEGIRIPFPVSTVQMEESTEWWRSAVGAGRSGRQ
jgi:small-conductance mechanosensitive channel